MKPFGVSGLPVRCVGHTSRQRPHSVHVNMSSFCFQVKSSIFDTPNFSASAAFSMSNVAIFPAGSSFAKNRFGSAVITWKCFANGR